MHLTLTTEDYEGKILKFSLLVIVCDMHLTECYCRQTRTDMS